MDEKRKAVDSTLLLQRLGVESFSAVVAAFFVGKLPCS
jgi:hypothetical protein